MDALETLLANPVLGDAVRVSALALVCAVAYLANDQVQSVGSRT